MRKPEIQKRLLSLLDIIFLLLCFFIVLPHGITSNEVLQIQSLQHKNQELTKELGYYQWQYGPLKPLTGRDYRARIFTLSKNQLYVEGELVSKDTWETRLKKMMEDNNINFVIISGDTTDRETQIGEVRRIEAILHNRQVAYIITAESVK
jgi:biopolymer transport protein ExbD